MPLITSKLDGLIDLKKNIQENPAVVKENVSQFLTKATALYMGIIKNSPWRMGGMGGGAPVAKVNGGKLRGSHQIVRTPWESRIFPTASYAGYVHGWRGQTVNKRGVQLRPWLDYAVDTAQKQVDVLEDIMVSNIIQNITK